MFAARETMEEPFAGNDVHRRLAVLMERTEPDEFVALGLETQLLTNEADKVGLSKYSVSIGISLGNYHE
jgi:hypothetical protein